MTRRADPAAGVRASNTAPQRMPNRHRQSLYMACLGLSFALLLVAVGRREGVLGMSAHGGIVFWAVTGFAAFGIIVGALGPSIGDGAAREGHAGSRLAAGWLVQSAVAVAAGLALVTAMDGGSPTWPSVLVLLFAGRALMEVAELRLWLAWQMPLQRHAPSSVQSVGAALAFGGFLFIVFEQLAASTLRASGASEMLAPGVAGDVPTATSIAIDALLGETPVHRALIYLFFVVMAFIADAWRLYRRDRAALAALGRLLAQPEYSRKSMENASGPTWSFAWDALASLHPGSRSLLACRTIANDADAAGQAAFRAVTDFHLASRRFIRSIVPLLPLLGFVGTVIGLSITLGELPRDTGNGARAAADISASLGGLAIKFQTTLLGLAGGMVASTALNALEKAETELMAECALLVSATLEASPNPFPLVPQAP